MSGSDHKHKHKHTTQQLVSLIKKRETCNEPFNYSDNVIVYVNLNNETNIYNNCKKAVEIEKQIINNKYNISIDEPIINNINKHLISCMYNITFNSKDVYTKEILIKKFTIKDVNMHKLIDDLNKHHVNVDDLLNEMIKSNLNLDLLIMYFSKNNIDIAKVMSILNRNGVTVTNLLENKFISDMVKTSSFAWICGGVEDKIENKNKHVKKINVYAIYDENFNIININWNSIKN